MHTYIIYTHTHTHTHPFFFFFFLGPHGQHMEVPKLAGKPELQLPAYITATATPGPSCVCDLHHSSRQHQILNPQSKARDQTHVLMGPHGFVTTEPQQALPYTFFFFFFYTIFNYILSQETGYSSLLCTVGLPILNHCG